MKNDQNKGYIQLARGLGWFSIGLGLAELLAPSTVSRLVGIRRHRTLLRTFGAREIAAGITILMQQKPAAGVWSRVAGDALDLTALGFAFASPWSKKNRLAIATASVAGVTALDFICAQKLSLEKDGRAVRTKSITVNRSPEEVYRFWHDFENLPRFMTHLESVRMTGGNRSHWVAKAPGGKTVEWDAIITEDKPGEKIAWKSVEGSDIENSGWVMFRPAPGGRGTEVHVYVEYNPPAGILGVGIAKLFGEEVGEQIKGDLYRFKQVIETGEVVHSDASIFEGMHPGQPPEDPVDYRPGQESRWIH
jgi:uncharacterized membrane protein